MAGYFFASILFFMNTTERDVIKDEILAYHGIKVLRFQNSELADIQKVLNKIRSQFSPLDKGESHDLS